MIIVHRHRARSSHHGKYDIIPEDECGIYRSVSGQMSHSGIPFFGVLEVLRKAARLLLAAHCRYLLNGTRFGSFGGCRSET